MDALRQRYVEMDAPRITEGNILPDAVVMTSKGHAKQIELVGEQKMRFVCSLCRIPHIDAM